MSTIQTLIDTIWNFFKDSSRFVDSINQPILEIAGLGSFSLLSVVSVGFIVGLLPIIILKWVLH